MLTSASIAFTLALVGVWLPMLLSIRAAGSEPVLLTLDRRFGTLTFPRVGVTTNIRDVPRIECISFATPAGRLDTIDSVLVIEPPGADTEYILLGRAHSRRLARRIAAALDLPIVDYHIGAVSSAPATA